MPADPFCCVFLVKQLVKLPQWWAQAGGTAAAQPFLYARAAVKSNEKGPSNGKLFTEEDWNVESKCDKAGAYSHSKVHLKAVRNSQAFLEIQKLTVLCTHEKRVALASALDSLGCMDSAPLNIISGVTPLWCQATWSPHQVTHSYFAPGLHWGTAHIQVLCSTGCLAHDLGTTCHSEQVSNGLQACSLPLPAVPCRQWRSRLLGKLQRRMIWTCV